MNKHILTLALGLALIATVTVPAIAAPKATANGESGTPKFGRTELLKSLGLTDAQKTKIEPIMAASKAQRKVIGDNESLTPEVQKAKKKAIRETEETKIAALLTPAQKAKYKAGLAKIKAKKAAEDKMKKG